MELYILVSTILSSWMLYEIFTEEECIEKINEIKSITPRDYWSLILTTILAIMYIIMFVFWPIIFIGQFCIVLYDEIQEKRKQRIRNMIDIAVIRLQGDAKDYESIISKKLFKNIDFMDENEDKFKSRILFISGDIARQLRADLSYTLENGQICLLFDFARKVHNSEIKGIEHAKQI